MGIYFFASIVRAANVKKAAFFRTKHYCDLGIFELSNDIITDLNGSNTGGCLSSKLPGSRHLG